MYLFPSYYCSIEAACSPEAAACPSTEDQIYSGSRREAPQAALQSPGAENQIAATNHAQTYSGPWSPSAPPAFQTDKPPHPNIPTDPPKGSQLRADPATTAAIRASRYRDKRVCTHPVSGSAIWPRTDGVRGWCFTIAGCTDSSSCRFTSSSTVRI